MSTRRVRRWRVALVGTLALTTLGLLYAEATLLVGAAIPLVYVLYGALSRVPAGASLSVSRAFAETDPAPGEAVTVRLTVTNDGASVLPDVRVVDGVPPELSVAAGSPRSCVSLSPGDTETFTYEVVAKRGDYTFADPVVRLRSLSASVRSTAEVSVAGDTTLRCANAVREPPLADATLPRAGTLPTDSGGSGLEFYATREYRPGDPMNRVDWRHYAKTGEFVTVQYREEQAIHTVLVVDARPPGRVTQQQGYPTGAELSAYAARRLDDALERAGVVRSVTALGLDGSLEGITGADGVPWVDGESEDRPARARRLFDAVEAAADGDASPVATRLPDGVAADGGPDRRTERLLTRLPPNAQVVLCTPMTDNWPVSFTRSLAVRGYSTVVVSPDVTGGTTTGQRVASVQRRLRLTAAERAGAATVSWNLEQPIDYALRLSLPYLLTR